MPEMRLVMLRARTIMGLVQMSAVYSQQMRIMITGKNIRDLNVAIKR